MINTQNKEPRCCFCNKGRAVVNKLIANNSILICDECVRLCYQILSMETLIAEGTTPDNVTPSKVYSFLDEYIIGQPRAKKILSVAVYNHYKRINRNISNITESEGDELSKVEISKSNILLIGPTGCGKTLFAQTLAKMLHVPIVIADATSLTEIGYVGEDVTDLLARLLSAAGGNPERAKRGIIYIDEIDKIRLKNSSGSITRDVSGEGVQQGLLKLMEGTTVNVPLQSGRRHPTQEMVPLKTDDILFICGGAFDGLSKVVQSRTNKSGMGFGAHVSAPDAVEVNDLLPKVESEDLVKYGFIPEFIGRLPVVATLDALKRDDLISIMTKPKNAIIKQYQALLHMDDVQLSVAEDALSTIADVAIAKKTGARALRGIVENLLLDTMFDVPDNKDIASVLIDSEVVSGVSKPKLTYKTKTKGKKIKQKTARAA